MLNIIMVKVHCYHEEEGGSHGVVGESGGSHGVVAEGDGSHGVVED